MSRRDEEWEDESVSEVWEYAQPASFWLSLVLLVALVLWASCAHAAPRAGSYASQRWDGAPLSSNGVIDEAAVRTLAAYDDVTLELVPWAQDVNGRPQPWVPLMLRQMNPNIRLWAYVLCGDFWLSPAFKPQATDRSAYRDIFDALNAGNGWLYDTNGAPWDVNCRVNLADSATVRRLGDIYVRLVKLHLFDGIFLDCVGDIWWTQHEGHRLDVERAGFHSMAQVDSARAANTARLIARLHEAGGCGFLVAANGVPATGADVDFREGAGTLWSLNEMRAWMRAPGLKWMKAECYDSTECAKKLVLLKSAALGSERVIISAGPNRGWPPVGR